ncbi:hypothetical protein HYH03_004556 [Edaphochlamys debaryana]|uniref:Heme-binding protein n=1 Tax=Edaphochlamys debaryana TaxID=47281 RepID=A0A835Y7C5_9CHLO|nr:hypothetical protein HYH03_004556 [Edaphochlamys debaryana]|eukprot:KAG2497401.1 hypothetical protein HYH03_004556 [Edaphochlamys debaryana]
MYQLCSIVTMRSATAALALVLALGAIAGASARTGLPDSAEVKAALESVLDGKNSGGSTEMWCTVINTESVVKVSVFSGDSRAQINPSARIVSGVKANTANLVSRHNSARSTANLYGLLQAGGGIFGIENTHPVNTAAAYKGPSAHWGDGKKDPLINQRLGGFIGIGGGLALYDETGAKVGALGISGDSACTDHIVAWRLRKALGLDYVPAGPLGPSKDNMGHGGSGLDASSHPICDAGAAAIVKDLPTNYPFSTVQSG